MQERIRNLDITIFHDPAAYYLSYNALEVIKKSIVENAERIKWAQSIVQAIYMEDYEASIQIVIPLGWIVTGGESVYSYILIECCCTAIYIRVPNPTYGNVVVKIGEIKFRSNKEENSDSLCEDCIDTAL